MQQNNNKKSICVSRAVHIIRMSITVWGMNIIHYPWKNTAIIAMLPLNAQSPISLYFPSISQSEKWKIYVIQG